MMGPYRPTPMWKLVCFGIATLAVVWGLSEWACGAEPVAPRVSERETGNLPVEGWLSADRGATPRPLHVSLAVPILWHGVFLGSDIASTRWAERRGAIEGNAAYGGSGKYALHAATGAVLVAADVVAQKHGQRWLVWTLRVGSALAWGRAALLNIRTGRAAQ